MSAEVGKFSAFVQGKLRFANRAFTCEFLGILSVLFVISLEQIQVLLGAIVAKMEGE